MKGALIFGFNATQVDGDEVYGYHKFGFNAGTSAIIPLGNNFFVSIEEIYNQKGSYKKKDPYKDTLNGEYKLKLNYVEVPVLFHYKDKGGMSIGTGFSWGRLVGFSEEEHEIKINWTKQTLPYNRDDIEWIFDAMFKIKSNLNFDFRYAYSIQKIRTRTFNNNEVRKQYHNILTFRLIWIFGPKDNKETKKQNTKNK